MEKTKRICTVHMTKVRSSVDPARSRPPPVFCYRLPPPPQGGTTQSPPVPPSPPSGGARDTILPTFVLRRKARTAGVALSPLEGRLADGALGCFYPQAFPTSFRTSLL